MKVCSTEGCNNKHRAKGLCMTCYYRVRRYGRTHTVRDGDYYSRKPGRPPTVKMCSVAGCGRNHYAKGLCQAHLRRWVRVGKDPMLTDDEPRVSTEPLVPALRKIADHGMSIWNGEARNGEADTISSVAERCSEFDGLSADAWRRRLQRILGTWTADGNIREDVSEGARLQSMPTGDVDILCYALGTHPIFFWPELWVPAQQGLDAA